MNYYHREVGRAKNVLLISSLFDPLVVALRLEHCFQYCSLLSEQTVQTIIMGLTEIRNICEVSLLTPAEKQPKLHNRWHPDIPFAGIIKNGETVKIECVRRSMIILYLHAFDRFSG